jgi:Aldo/keto reductase family
VMVSTTYSSTADAFSFPPSTTTTGATTAAKAAATAATKKTGAVNNSDKNVKKNTTNKKRSTPPPSVVVDTTNIGTLTVPTVGLGTISWSSNSFWGEIDNPEIQDVVKTACKHNGAFFDTAERYGSHTKTALGMGYGETERMTKLFLERAMEDGASSYQHDQQQQQVKPVIATKFTPLRECQL